MVASIAVCKEEVRNFLDMKLLFVGETWNGSSARSLRDSLAAIRGLEIDDIGEDQYRPRGRSLVIRGFNRILMPLYRREVADELLRRARVFKPDAVVIYKGNLVSAAIVAAIRRLGILVVNVFPDYSPHAYGRELRHAMGRYDLVISTKPFHPRHWQATYGYSNACVCVPHGYDPAVHYWPEAPGLQDIDVVLAASWRPQYETLMVEVGRLMSDAGISVALAGPGWEARQHLFPTHWTCPGPLFGRAYGEFVRRGKIVVAPVHADVFIDGRQQPGDEDTTRTYELAAARTFFLHRRTPFVSSVYQEGVESAFWSNAEELVGAIRHYLPLEERRRQMALAAHRRAVPAYSVPARAEQVIVEIRRLVDSAKGLASA